MRGLEGAERESGEEVGGPGESRGGWRASSCWTFQARRVVTHISGAVMAFAVEVGRESPNVAVSRPLQHVIYTIPSTRRKCEWIS